jgi:hypothetical protein
MRPAARGEPVAAKCGAVNSSTGLKFSIYYYIQNGACHDPIKIHILTSALVGGEWSASHRGRFTPEERAFGIHWMGHRAGLDIVEKSKFLTLSGLELRLLGYPPRSYSLYRLPYLGSIVNDRPILSSERMSQKDYVRKCSVRK